VSLYPNEGRSPNGGLSPNEEARVHGFFRAVAERLAAEVRLLGDAMAEAVVADVPGYGWEVEGDADDFRGGIRRTAHLYVRTLHDHRPLRGDERVALHVIGAQRARQAVPTEMLTAGVRAGLQACWRYVVRVVDEHTRTTSEKPSAEAMGALAAHHFAFADDVLDALREGYRTEVEQRLTGRVRAQAAFIDRLLEGHWDDEGQARSHARALGHDLGPACGMLLVLPAAAQDSDQLRAGASAVVASLPEAVEGPLRALPVPHVLALLPVRSERHWTDALDAVADLAVSERVAIVPTEPVALPTSLPAVYRHAKRYLALVDAEGRGPGVVTVAELRLYAMLAGIPVSDRVEFVRDMLGGILDLPDHKARELLDTLEALYRRKGRIVDVAAELHLHQNSVRYRLGRVEELTGLSLDVPADRMHLELAMRLRKVATAELAALDDLSGEPVRRDAAERRGWGVIDRPA
jgi:hypothetical protein